MITDLAPWRSPLARNLHQHRSQPEARYFQLATVSPEGLPTNRTVVFRGFQTGTDNLQIISDRRSEKLKHLHYCPHSEACWYFPKTRQQFRILGEVVAITADNGLPDQQALRTKMWQAISDHARQQFTWATPAEPRLADQPFLSGMVDPQAPHENFCLLLLIPVRCDRLDLKSNPQNREIYCKHEGVWQVQAVNP